MERTEREKKFEEWKQSAIQLYSNKECDKMVKIVEDITSRFWHVKTLDKLLDMEKRNFIDEFFIDTSNEYVMTKEDERIEMISNTCLYVLACNILNTENIRHRHIAPIIIHC